MALVLYGHPFSSCTQKVLVALYENGTPFTWRMLDTPATFDDLARVWPLRLMSSRLVCDLCMRMISLADFLADHKRRHICRAVDAQGRWHFMKKGWPKRTTQR